jgi:2-polyprenyl-6-methoxyphenol hydroxylase-like FAD-dependent oxidoreductase
MGYGHAVVTGGSVAGLAAAQALAGTFDTVTLLERDRYPATGDGFRRGVPQARHTHILMEGGQRALQHLFPGLEDDLRRAGAHRIGTPEDVRLLSARGWCTQFPARRHLLSLSRELLDHLVRQRLTATPNVKIIDRCAVTGLLPGPTGVRGVRLARADGSLEELDADLVVDATGRNTRTPDWLAQLGYGSPPQTRIDASLAYATRRYRIPDGYHADWKVTYLLAKPPRYQRIGALFQLEGNRWTVTLCGAGGDRPPTDEAGFLEFARSLRSPLIYDTIRHAEPLSDISAFQRTENRRRHYEKLHRWPDGLIVLGDAACAFNPIYGQGMSVAAQTALALQHTLRHSAPDQPGFAKKMQRTIARCVDAAWLIATGEDLRYPTTTGASAGPATWLAHRWLDRVASAATIDRTVNAALVDVIALVAPPSALFRPSLAWHTLRTRRPAETDVPAVPATP